MLKILKTRPSKKLKDYGQFSILIVCEDRKSSVYYLEGKRDECNLSNSATIEKLKIAGIAVDIEGGNSAPISVVDYAITKRDEYNARAKKMNIYPYKKVYCVMDVDEHPSLKPAVDKINSVNRTSPESELIHIISNECFEVWYILHFKYTTGALYRPSSKNPSDAHRIDKVLEDYLGQEYDKSAPDIFKLIKAKGGNEEQAIRYAEKLEKYHKDSSPDTEPYLCNPSTEVYKLINELNRLSSISTATKPDEVGEITQPDLKNASYPFQDDEFTNTLVALVNKYYPAEPKAYKIQLLIDMFEHFDPNIACIEQPEIAEFFYQNYKDWKDSKSSESC